MLQLLAATLSLLLLAGVFSNDLSADEQAPEVQARNIDAGGDGNPRAGTP